MLANRGYKDADAAKRFLDPTFAHLPDPKLLKNMDDAVAAYFDPWQEAVAPVHPSQFADTLEPVGAVGTPA